MPEETPAVAAQAADAAPSPAQAATNATPEAADHPELREARREAQNLRKRLREIETAQQQAEEARLQAAGEYKTLAEQARAEADGLKAQLAQRDHAALVARIAATHALPAALADRLRGATEEELTADAKALAKLIPAPAPPPAPDPAPPPDPALPTNPARPAAGAAAGAPVYTFATLPTWGNILGQPPK